jgi:hypothetical protein
MQQVFWLLNYNLGELHAPPTFSSERMLHKGYYRKGYVERNISGREFQGVWQQDELIGCKPPVVK